MALYTKESGFQEPTNRLLDPGPPPRPKRKLGCKCFLWTFLALLGLGATWIVFLFLRAALTAVQNPHSKLYQDMTQPYRLQDVVRPLIDNNQTFDVIATVWLRTEQDPGADDLAQPNEMPEKAIFSQTIFTGLTLKDKQLTTSVDFQVPTSIFKQKNLNNYDLRGSFVLVPTSTSVLDHVHSFSSWVPEEAGYPPVRSWVDHDATLKDEVIDSYGTFTPLLTFYDIKSRCPQSDSSSNSDDAVQLDDDDVEQDENAFIPVNALKTRQRWTSTKGKSVLSAHPYIITRSFVGVADMTKVLNKEAYDNVHNALRTLSCGRLVKVVGHPVRARWQDCSRSFSETGNQEVRIKIARPTGKNDKFQTEWLYAPYLIATRTRWGPHDLEPIPVNREVCQPQSDIKIPSVPDKEYVNVTWNIAFSVKSPAQLGLMETLDLRTPKHNMTDKALKHLLQQHQQESTDGLFGHTHRVTYHPRRNTALKIVGKLIFYAFAILELLYWYTRTSTSGISISGTAILALVTLLNLVMGSAFHRTLQEEKPLWEISFAWTLVTESTFRAVLMLKTINRAEIEGWRKTWIPVLSFAPATHSERRSERLDSRMTWKTVAIIYAVLAAFFTVIYQFKFYIILPRGRVTVGKHRLFRYLYAIPPCAILPALVLGRLLQIVLNFRSKTFAGMYRATAYVKMMELTFAILSRSPWIVGEALVNAPVTYFDMFELLGCVMLAYQSHKYPVASDVDEEDDTR